MIVPFQKSPPSSARPDHTRYRVICIGDITPFPVEPFEARTRVPDTPPVRTVPISHRICWPAGTVFSTYLPFAKRPEIHPQADQVIDPRIGALIQQQRHQAADGIYDQPGLDAPVHGAAGDERQRPFPGETDDAQDEIENLEDGDGAHSAVEGFGEEIPEDLGPEEPFQGGGDLVWTHCR